MDKILRKTQKDYNIIASHFSEKRRYIWQDIKPFLKYIKPGKKLLDAGCGNGRLYKELKSKKVNYLGIDFSQELLKIAKKENPRASFKYGDISQAKTWGKYKDFDVICSIAVFHNLYNKALQLKTLGHIKKSLKPGGIFIITAWNMWQKQFLSAQIKQIGWKIRKGFKFRWFIYPYKISDGRKIIKQVDRFFYCYTPCQLSNLLKKSGFEIIEKKIGRNLCFACKKKI